MNELGNVEGLAGQSDALWQLTTVGLTLVLLMISLADLRSFRIPDVLSLPLIAAGLVVAWFKQDLDGHQTDLSDHLIGASSAFLLFAVLGEIVFRRTGREALGLGDAKLFGAAGAWLGWQALPLVLLIASLGGLFFALIFRRSSRGSAIPFGPWIALGIIMVWLTGAT